MQLERMQRQLSSLSDSIFGVSMTMLAIDATLPMQLATSGGWMALLGMMSLAIEAIALSFVIAALFWVSHHRRLSLDAGFSRTQLVGNLAFLLGIVLLPISTRAFNSLPAPVGTPLLGMNLMLVGAVDMLLWLVAVRRIEASFRNRLRMLIAPAYTTALLLAGGAIAQRAPWSAQLCWYAAFLGPLLDSRFSPHDA